MPPTTSQAATQGAFEVAQRSRLPQGAACGQPPSRGREGSVWQIFTLEQLKATLEYRQGTPPTIGRSVAYRHCITGYCYSCVSYGITHRHKTAYTAPKWLR